MRRPASIAVSILLILVALDEFTLSQTKLTPLLEYSCSGSGKPGASRREFNQAIEHPEVQRVLLDIAAEPRDRAWVEEALKGTDVKPELLQDLTLIQIKGNKCTLSFPLLTGSDFDKIRALAEVEGAVIAKEVLAHRSEIERLLTSRPQPGVDWKEVAFFIVGCVSLDWDGLNLLREKRYLADPEKGKLAPEAYEIGGRGSVRGLYWGSHNMHDSIAFTSFGDHDAFPRHTLPDLLWNLGRSLNEMEAPSPVKKVMVKAADELIRRRAGLMMLALRDGDKDLKQLAAAASITENEAEAVLNLLRELRFVSISGDRYRAAVTVLTESDRAVVKQLRQMGREIMLKWLQDRYPEASRQLAVLSPVRSGVPLPRNFYWVWHYIFGTANRELVAGGLFADPYDSARSFKGFVPAVYPLRVAMGDF